MAQKYIPKSCTQPLLTTLQSKVLFHILYRKDHLSYFWNIQTCKTANLHDRFYWTRSSWIHSWLKFWGLALLHLQLLTFTQWENHVCSRKPANWKFTCILWKISPLELSHSVEISLDHFYSKNKAYFHISLVLKL